ncbi:hypothetical protein HanRHA438_Chr08g0355271 [Helianthus annuus]|uniref:Uncharacterized protein n=1 Tax=Helianthus annuus TaxID=4232 RepID=A0A9K3ND10_HELAN|nr:hypothetical protein HanXRQr2_Chr08g0343841 [Helianthus annuus]KAJ0898298.1 hypothetical protein HanRHA438_Chr08g0355271 [Helianthus annuus]
MKRVTTKNTFFAIDNYDHHQNYLSLHSHIYLYEVFQLHLLCLLQVNHPLLISLMLNL